jgi:hypothetical protein
MRCLPHGCYSLFVATICTMAWIASLFQDGCDFAKVSGPIVAELTTAGEIPPPWLEFGIGAFRSPSSDSIEGQDTWYSDFEEECQLFEEESENFMDTAWTTARTFAFLALVIGGGGTVFLWASTFFVFSRGTWRWTGYLIMIGSLCNSMTFLWFLTSVCGWNTCTIFWGAKADMVASSLWFLGGLLIICKYPLPISQRLQQQQQQIDSMPTASVMAVEGNDGTKEGTFTRAELV